MILQRRRSFGDRGIGAGFQLFPPPERAGERRDEVTLHPQGILLTADVPGRIAASATADVRPQVSAADRVDGTSSPAGS